MKGNSRTKLFLIQLLLLSGFLTGASLSAQVSDFKYFYRVYFKDKGAASLSGYSAGDLLSRRAIARREKAGIPVPEFSDLPVSRDYIDQVRAKGFTLHCTSKWMNTGLFKTSNQADIGQILALPFVSDVKTVKIPVAKSSFINKLDFSSETVNPPFDSPVTMLNGQSLHNSGFDGSGILIAILDGGFLNSELISSLNSLRSRNGIRATRDFVSGGNYVYDYHYHGTAVLSVLAGNHPGLIAGTAPGADFLLIRTEDVFSEFPVEEDYWAAGAEYADSAGADIISSSLGYFTFDNPAMNYKFSDMNGRNTFVTRAANNATSKGILVVNSAGNERTNNWLRIVAPADGFNVVAAGATDWTGEIAVFSSAGPSADGRIKPDNTTQGVNVPVQITDTSIARASGTSFSCPVLSGMCACIMQAVPRAGVSDIAEALHKNGSRFNNPDSLYGYGIPDMEGVLATLQEQLIPVPVRNTIVGPNPFTSELEVTFKSSPGTVTVIIFTSSGQIVFKKTYPEYISRTLRINDLQHNSQGLYFLTIITGEGTFSHKIIKINN
jgi:serine protease AprX